MPADSFGSNRAIESGCPHAQSRENGRAHQNHAEKAHRVRMALPAAFACLPVEKNKEECFRRTFARPHSPCRAPVKSSTEPNCKSLAGTLPHLYPAGGSNKCIEVPLLSDVLHLRTTTIWTRFPVRTKSPAARMTRCNSQSSGALTSNVTSGVRRPSCVSLGSAMLTPAQKNAAP